MIDDRNMLRAYDGKDRARYLFGDDEADTVQARVSRLFGEVDGFGGWTRSAVFDADTLVFPGAVEVQAAPEFVDLTVDALRVALAWDDGQIAQGGPVDVQAGKIVSLPVDAKRGQRLEVWTSAVFAFGDSFGSARYLGSSEAKAREQERAAESQKQANQGAPDPNALLKGAGAAIAVVAVAVAVVLYLRSKG
jgi:hypothetical protein